MAENKRFFVYILQCADNTFYTGYTVDSVQKRVEAHNQGIGAKYTRGRRPVHLVYEEECPSKSEAMKKEWRLKTYNKVQKMELIQAHSQQKATAK